MFCAIYSARRPIEAVVETETISTAEAAMARDAHHTFPVADGGFAAFQASALARVEASTMDALRNALLLIVAPLVDGDGMALHGSWCCLSKAKG
jgi:hypothetical protein